MEQQLRSLYTAFGLIREEQDAADLERVKLEINLNEADGEIARQVDSGQNQGGNRQRTPQQTEAMIDLWGSPSLARSGIPSVIQTPSTNRSSLGTPVPPLSRVLVHAQRTATPTVTAQPHDTVPLRTPSTWELLFPEARTGCSQLQRGNSGMIIQGYLLIRSRSVVRKWKSKFCKLYLFGNHYQWDMEEKSFTLGKGVSKVEFNPNHPLSFTVHCNPYDSSAAVVQAATTSEDDYHRWFDALSIAMDLGMHEDQCTAPMELQRISGLGAQEQEAAELEEALRLSRSTPA
mmetsp:Transcript_117549/g.339850  ORF Transcript_117549/g.339850 Transcript_117549/m.339850 type:complete len:289 (+) Transcript_117549:665-1531(+)